MLINNRKYLLLSHYATYAMQDTLCSFLSENKCLLVTRIDIPLPELPLLRKIIITDYSTGRMGIQRSISTIVKPPIIAYLIHAIQVFVILIIRRQNYDVVIAQNSLLTAIGLILRKLNICNVVVFYSHGIDRSRFSGVKGYLFKVLDEYAALNSDYNWILSAKMAQLRISQGIKKETLSHVPATVPVERIKFSPVNINKTLVFLGTLNSMNGVMILPEIMKLLVKEDPDFKLDIIGAGPLEEELRKVIRDKGLTKSIKLFGLQGLENYAGTLTYHIAALAPYVPSGDNLLQLTDPMKIRIYCAAGLPVFVSKSFDFSDEIQRNGIGYQVEYAPYQFARKIMKLAGNIDSIESIRKRVRKYSYKYDELKVYAKSISKIN